jgi:Zn-dependent peptidase ImmA (M78 family)/transcriptional regulator with XRE-family HTH domain
MPTQQAYITPSVLKWARQRCSLSVEQAAAKVPTRPEQLASWEHGGSESKPTLRQAQKLAHILHVPFGYLFLSSPPGQTVLLPDLRTVADDQRNSFSPDFLELLNDVLLKQQWIREFREVETYQRLQFVGKFSARDNANTIANDISVFLGVNDDFREEAANWENFLVRLIGNVETLGVLVLRSGIVKNDTHRKLSVDEFRGFVIKDELAPLVFINGNDSRAAQIFTLIHELAHIWIGQSGISNFDLGNRQLSANQNIERLCNRVAAEVLVPQSSFQREWQSATRISENLARLTRIYRVSSLVILRRALDLEKLTWQKYLVHYQEEKEKYQQREARVESSGGNFYATLGSRNSKQLIKAVLSQALEGRLLYRDAARLLSVKVEKLGRVASEFGVR